MKEIKGKSILVRVSARFELARLKLSGVDCILNILEYDQSNAPLNGHHELPGGGGWVGRGAPIRLRRGRSSSRVQVEIKY